MLCRFHSSHSLPLDLLLNGKNVLMNILLTSLSQTAMPHTPIIRSLLDTDLYKFTMLQVVLHQFPQAHGVYEFRCRNPHTEYPLADIKADFERELDALCTLQLTTDELNYLRQLRFIKSDFVDYLELF